MDIAKLFNPLALRPNIEIIKPRLPESLRMNWGFRDWGPRNWGPRNWGPRNWGPRNWGAPGLAGVARPGTRTGSTTQRMLVRGFPTGPRFAKTTNLGHPKIPTKCSSPELCAKRGPLREILNDDQKKKLDQLEQQAHPELHGNLNGATPPPRHHRFEESAVTYRARRWANNLSI